MSALTTEVFMNDTNTAPNVPIDHFKRTKIIATIGPATASYEKILALIKAGANGIRLNFSHGTHEEMAQYAKWVREASKEYGKPVAIIQDLQGPKIRLGDFEGMINVETGQKLRFQLGADFETTGIIPIQYDLSKKMKPGERLYLFDGKVHTKVTEVKDGIVHATAENDGYLLMRKGINLPDTDFGGDVITKKDRADIAFGATQDFDYVAQSFVQTEDDIRNLRKILKSHNYDARVIVKFETSSAVDHIDAIVQETDMIMVARGDLAVETRPEVVPIVQRKLIGLGTRYAKPVIVATHMMFSMTELPEPTRAEVSDVATAVILGADCVMLSDETAIGKYPVETVEMMKRVILHTQENNPVEVVFPEYEVDDGHQGAISSAIITLAKELDAVAIVTETLTGATALQIAAKRTNVPIIAVTSSERTAHQLAVVHGIKSYVRPVDEQAAAKLTNWLRDEKIFAKGDVIVTVSGKYPGVVGMTDTIKVRVVE